MLCVNFMTLVTYKKFSWLFNFAAGRCGMLRMKFLAPIKVVHRLFTPSFFFAINKQVSELSVM